MTFIRFFNQLKTIPVIKRCTNCKYYLITENSSYANNLCVRVIYKCSDTCVNKYEYAYITRADKEICGPNGSHFLQKYIK